MSARLQINKSNLSRLSLTKPSSRLRTPGCSTSSASALTISPNHWSSRLRLRRCYGLFVVRPGELEPVFDTILANATRICEAEFGFFIDATEMSFEPLQCTVHRQR